MTQYKNEYRTACSKKFGLAWREVWPLPPVPGKLRLNSWNFLSESSVCYSWWAPQAALDWKGWGAGDRVQSHGQSISHGYILKPQYKLDNEAQRSLPGWQYPRLPAHINAERATHPEENEWMPPRLCSTRLFLWPIFCTPSQQQTTTMRITAFRKFCESFQQIIKHEGGFQEPPPPKLAIGVRIESSHGDYALRPCSLSNTRWTERDGSQEKKTCSIWLKMKEIQIKIRLFFTCQAGKT